MEATDRDLVGRARAGCQEACHALVVRYGPPVAAVARSFLTDRNEAEDLVQEVFMRAFVGLAGLRDPDRLSGWLYQITRNLARNRIKSRRRQPVALPLEAVADPPAREKKGEGGSALAALGRLPADFQVVLRLRHLEGMGLEEIATALGLSPNGVNSRLYRARKLLREKMGKGERS